MNLTKDEFFSAFMPLLLALHEKQVIDLAELPHYYEDALVRRKLDLGEGPDSLVFLQDMIQGLTALANTVKGRNPAP